MMKKILMLIFALILTALMLTGCANDCQSLGHDCVWPSCFESGECSRCGMKTDIRGHMWEKENYDTPMTCTECGIRVVLPEITDRMRLHMPELRPEFKQAMRDSLTPEVEQEIDTFAASLRYTYDRYLQDGETARAATNLISYYFYRCDIVPAVETEADN